MLPEISILFELLVAGMLAVMIYYAWRLNEKLRNLQNDRAELERLLTTFGELTERAEASILHLKGNATETVQGLDDRVVKAVTLRDELAQAQSAPSATAGRECPNVRNTSAEPLVTARYFEILSSFVK